jgi:hypothetical protein
MRDILRILRGIAWWIAFAVFTVTFGIGLFGMVGALVDNERTLFWPAAREFLFGLMGLALLTYIQRRRNEERDKTKAIS